MIILTDLADKSILMINETKIISIEKAKTSKDLCAYILCNDNNGYFVEETPNEVMAKIKAARISWEVKVSS